MRETWECRIRTHPVGDACYACWKTGASEPPRRGRRQLLTYLPCGGPTHAGRADEWRELTKAQGLARIPATWTGREKRAVKSPSVQLGCCPGSERQGLQD